MRINQLYATAIMELVVDQSILENTWEIVAGCLALTSVLLSIISVSGHLRNFTKPYLQRYIVRILLMVPIYSMNAWIAMIYPPCGIFLDSARECYESFVIYSFMKYLLNFLTYDTNLQQYIDQKPATRQVFPFCWLPACPSGRFFMINCKHGILQYVVIRPMSSLIAFASELSGIYGEGNLNPLSGKTYPLLFLINNGSQLVAMYSLLIFYTGYRHELKPMDPLVKFFSIKLVIFFSFFQSVAITGLLEFAPVYEFAMSLFPNSEHSKLEVSKKLQELLICFDMLIAACAHWFAFPHTPYVDETRHLLGYPSGSVESINDPSNMARSRHARNNDQASIASSTQSNSHVSCWSAFWSLFDFRDERADFTETFSDASEKVRQLFRRQSKLPEVVVVSRGG